MPARALTSEVGPSRSAASPTPTYSARQLAVIVNKAVEERMEKLVRKNGKWKTRTATALLEWADEIEEQVANRPPSFIYEDAETHSEALNTAQEAESKVDEALRLIKEMKAAKEEEEDFKAAVDSALDAKMRGMALDIKNNQEEFRRGIGGLETEVGELRKKQEFALKLMRGFQQYLELDIEGSGSGLPLLAGGASAVEVADKGVRASKADKAEQTEETEEKEDKGKGKEKEKEDGGEGAEGPAPSS
jgi:hypothetical protein